MKNYRLAVSHEEMNSRRRNTMEDVHRIIPALDGLDKYSYFAIYDGHGGRQIVDYLEGALEKNITNELKLTDEATVAERLTRAFLITDMESRKLNVNTSGATAVSVLLYCNKLEDGTCTHRTLHIANVGDSRAVLVSSLKPDNPDCSFQSENGFVATRLSVDHSAEDPAEQQRIKEAGGFITRNRVLGILAVSRSFGDHGMKEFVTAEPHTRDVDLLHCGDCPMLILACDGVWDVFSDQEAADLLLPRYLSEGPFADAAEMLVAAAIQKGSADNVTSIVVFP
jgi:serine/threonine protein phosphatase PrpC